MLAVGGSTSSYGESADLSPLAMRSAGAVGAALQVGVRRRVSSAGSDARWNSDFLWLQASGKLFLRHDIWVSLSGVVSTHEVYTRSIDPYYPVDKSFAEGELSAGLIARHVLLQADLIIPRYAIEGNSYLYRDEHPRVQASVVVGMSAPRSLADGFLAVGFEIPIEESCAMQKIAHAALGMSHTRGDASGVARVKYEYAHADVFPTGVSSHVVGGDVSLAYRLGATAWSIVAVAVYRRSMDDVALRADPFMEAGIGLSFSTDSRKAYAPDVRRLEPVTAPRCNGS